MKVSKNTLQLSYTIEANHFFLTRNDRNTYFASFPAELYAGVMCAIGGDPLTTPDDAEVWEAEMYNGVNWTLQTIDQSFSLVVTEDGINAITYVGKQQGYYQLKITAVKIRENNIVNPLKNIMQWTKEDFEADGDIVLDSTSNANFTLDNNLSYRTNMANGGIQFAVKIDTNTYGERGRERLDEYTIGSIGLYVQDPIEPTRQVLFAIGNLNNKIPKYNTKADRVGNAVKILLNTVITNLGYVANLTVFPESVNSIPEVNNEQQLVENYGTVISPYNFYLVDNYAGTNLPALAARRGDPTKEEVTWEYFTPRDDVIEVDSTQFASDVQEYMVVTWDATEGKFVRATGGTSDELTYINVMPRQGSTLAADIYNRDTTKDSDYTGFIGWTSDANVTVYSEPQAVAGYHVYLDPTTEISGDTYSGTILSPASNNLTGIKSGNNVIFAGNVNNFNIQTQFDITISDGGSDYTINDCLKYTDPVSGITFKIKVTNVDEIGRVLQFTTTGISGTGTVAISNAEFMYNPDEQIGPANGNGFKANIVSAGTSTSVYVWDFPSTWYNCPLYVDKQIPTYDGDGRTDGRGRFTNIETDYFVGWCTGTGSHSSIKLAMDLADQASTVDYGTTRYATDSEINNPSSSQATSKNITTTLWSLKNNYLQITKPGVSRPDGNGHEGDAINNPVVVDSFVKFNETIVGKGVPNMQITQSTTIDQNVSFFGLAYRAWWGDLAEYYRSDKVYPAGTLITIGCGPAEITQAITECNGIVSERPGYELGQKNDPKDLPVALVGKVPVIFDDASNPQFGDRVYLSSREPGRASTVPYGQCLGKIIDKGKDLKSQSTILCSVRISF